MARALPVLAMLVVACVGFVVWGGVAFDADVCAIYAATLGVAHGLSPWNEAALAAQLSHELGQARTVLPFGYLAWVVMVSLPLGWLEYGQAERLFMLYNVAWLLVAAGLLTVSRDGRERWVYLGMLTLYPPTLGLIVVGQMTLPVLTGAALALVGWRRRAPWMPAFAALLLSFKWHIGGIPALGFAVLLWRDHVLLRRTAGPLVIVFAVASVLGLLLDPLWPLHYIRSVLALSVSHTVMLCDTCSSLAWTISTRSALPTSAVGLALLLLGTVAIAARGLVRDPRAFIAIVIALTLVCLPYVRNYDYVLLALTLVVAFCWLLTLVVPFAPRTAADELLGGSALVLFALIWLQGVQAAPSAAD